MKKRNTSTWIFPSHRASKSLGFAGSLLVTLSLVLLSITAVPISMTEAYGSDPKESVSDIETQEPVLIAEHDAAEVSDEASDDFTGEDPETEPELADESAVEDNFDKTDADEALLAESAETPEPAVKESVPSVDRLTNSRNRSSGMTVECSKGVVFSVQETGTVVKLVEGSDGKVTKSELVIEGLKQVYGPMGDPGWATHEDDVDHPYQTLNGIAVSKDGKIILNALRQSRPNGMPSFTNGDLGIFIYEGNAWNKYVFTGFIELADGGNFVESEQVFGAFNEKDQKYYFGGFTKGKTRRVLSIFSWDPSAPSTKPVTVAQFQPNLGVSVINGDMAFDSSGNLYLVVGPVEVQGAEKSWYKVLTIKNEDLASPSTDVSVSSTEKIELDHFSGGFNGIAFDNDGSIYFGGRGPDGNKVVDKVVKGNPVTGKVVDGGAVWATLAYSSDLASCSQPPSITLKKNVVERVSITDQFELTLNQPTDEVTGQVDVYGQVVTVGKKTGIQSEQVGPFPIYAPGTYTFSESAKSGNLGDYSVTWKCESTDINGDTVEIGKGSGAAGSVVVEDDDKNPRDIVCIFTNKPKGDLSSLKLIKTDEKGARLEGATFQLWKDGSPSEFENATLIEGSEKTTDLNGEILWDELEAGGYWIKETVAPEGYRILEEPQFVSVTGEQSVVTVTITNQPLGSVSWKKVDSDDTKQLLVGSKWKLSGPKQGDERIIDDCVQSPCIGPDQDPVPGKFEVKNLDYGEYTLTETDAPAGYAISTDPINFTVGEGEGLQLNHDLGPIGNRKQLGSLKWRKVVAGTNNPLAGSEWTLTDSDQVVLNISDCVTDECPGPDTHSAPGEFLIENLEPGTYKLQETKAPAGYVLDTSVHEVIITDSGEVTTKGPFGNKKADVPTLPITGGTSTQIFLLLGGGLIAAAMVSNLLNRRCQNSK